MVKLDIVLPIKNATQLGHSHTENGMMDVEFQVIRSHEFVNISRAFNVVENCAIF